MWLKHEIASYLQRKYFLHQLRIWGRPKVAYDHSIIAHLARYTKITDSTKKV